MAQSMNYINVFKYLFYFKMWNKVSILLFKNIYITLFENKIGREIND